MGTIKFSYFKEKEAGQYSFYRIPKALFTDESFRTLSCDAKVLYGMMLDRMGLSIKNQWFDSEGRAYIIFTIEDVMGMLGCQSQKAVRLMKELDTAEGIGLIEKKRVGLGRPNIIYVKNFMVREDGGTDKDAAVQRFSRKHGETVRAETGAAKLMGAQQEGVSAHAGTYVCRNQEKAAAHDDESWQADGMETGLEYADQIESGGNTSGSAAGTHSDFVQRQTGRENSCEVISAFDNQNFGFLECCGGWTVSGSKERMLETAGMPKCVRLQKADSRTGGSIGQEYPVAQPRNSEKHSFGIVDAEAVELRDTKRNNTDMKETEYSKNENSYTDFSVSHLSYPFNLSNLSNLSHPIHQPCWTGTAILDGSHTGFGQPDGRAGKMDAYREAIRENISYACFQPQEMEDVDELVELMADTMTVPDRHAIRIAGSEKPAAAVKDCFMKLAHSHIQYVIGCLQKHTGKIWNIKAYLLTALYNSAFTIRSYYRAEANHDLYGC